jgi:hypothetical protein
LAVAEFALDVASGSDRQVNPSEGLAGAGIKARMVVYGHFYWFQVLCFVFGGFFSPLQPPVQRSDGDHMYV